MDGDFEKIFLRSRLGVPEVIVVVTPPYSAVRRESFSVDEGFSLLGFLAFDSFVSGTELRLDGLVALGAVCVGVEGERLSGVVKASLDPGDNVRGEAET